MNKHFLAWGIDLNTGEGYGLAGRYFFGYPVPKHMEGCEIALFKTRKVARGQLVYVRQGGVFPYAKVVRLQVTIRRP